MATEAKTWSD